MASVACSLQPMDVRFLKGVMAALQGGSIPDFKAEASRRSQRDILLNWSRKVIRAAAPIADAVPREHWLLYTQLRPFFITTNDALQAIDLVDRLFTAHSLDDVLNFFREEVARIDPDQADAIVDRARQDSTPGVLPQYSVEDIAAHMRAYLLAERRQLEALAQASQDRSLAPEQLHDAGRWLAWRTCNLLANLHPSWSTRATSVTKLASRDDLQLAPLVADPRGMFVEIANRIPGLHAHIPCCLSGSRQTGLCITPGTMASVRALIASWPHPIAPHPQFGAPTPGEFQALKEAVVYAEYHQFGLWEAVDMLDPKNEIFPHILHNHVEREEKSIPEVRSSIPAMAGSVQADSISGETAPLSKSVSATDTQTSGEASTTAGKTPWLKKIIKGAK